MTTSQERNGPKVHAVLLTADEMAHLMIAARSQAQNSGAARWLESAANKLQDVLAPLGEASPRKVRT